MDKIYCFVKMNYNSKTKNETIKSQREGIESLY